MVAFEITYETATAAPNNRLTSISSRCSRQASVPNAEVGCSRSCQPSRPNPLFAASARHRWADPRTEPAPEKIRSKPPECSQNGGQLGLRRDPSRLPRRPVRLAAHPGRSVGHPCFGEPWQNSKSEFMRAFYGSTADESIELRSVNAEQWYGHPVNARFETSYVAESTRSACGL
jgi:hypothetical protein